MSDNNVTAQRMHQQCWESGKLDQQLVEDASKRARISADQFQNGDFLACTGSSLLGLKFDVSTSFVDWLNKSLCERKQVHLSSHQNQGGSYLKNGPKARRATSRSFQQKLKASNLDALLFRIGSWQKQSSPGGELIVKLYYAKRRMVWEILGGILKFKIEIEWTDIMGIRAFTMDLNGPAILEIQRKPSSTKKLRHTSWAPVSDFTGGQATIMRRHLVVFPPGPFEKHYKQLLNCDARLLTLSQIPFPDQECPFFDSNMFSPPQNSLHFNGGQLGFESTFVQPSANPTAPDVNYPSQPTDLINYPTVWDQGTYVSECDVSFQDINSITQGQDELLSCEDYGTYISMLDDPQKGLLDGGQVLFWDDAALLQPQLEAMIQSHFQRASLQQQQPVADNNLPWLPSAALTRPYSWCAGQESDKRMQLQKYYT